MTVYLSPNLKLKPGDVLAYGLFDVLRSNPTLLEWLEGI